MKKTSNELDNVESGVEPSIKLSDSSDKVENDSNKSLFAQFDQIFDNNIRIPDQKAWIILCGYNIGETAQVCALAGEFIKEHGHGIILVVTPKHVPVARMYAHRFLKIVTMPDEYMRYILRSGYIPQDRFELDQPLSGCWIDLGFRHSEGIKYLPLYPGRGGISESDLWRFVFRLPWNARLESPKILSEWEDEAWQLARKVGLVTGKSVLLCPINNSNKRLPDIFWKTLAMRLKENGFTVFTNMGGLNPFNGPLTMPIEETVPVDLPIHLVMPFMNFCGRAVSGPNGMLVLTMLARFQSLKLTNLITLISDSKEVHSSLGFRSHLNRQRHLIATSLQYGFPELGLRTQHDEYMVTYEASHEELSRLAIAVADQNTDDPSYFKRLETNGKPYVEEHADWLRELV